MNLDQLYQLRLEIMLNPNKVISKTVFLSVLDQLIGTLNGQNDIKVIQDVNESIQTPQSVKTIDTLKQVRLPPNMDEVKKSYAL